MNKDLCQAGMFRHWWFVRGSRWQARAAPNVLGAGLTGAAAVVVAAEKFTAGAWLIVVVIPVLVALFTAVRTSYSRIGRILELDVAPHRPRCDPSVVVVPVVGISRLTEESLSTALSMGDRVVALHVVLGRETDDRRAAALLRDRWQDWRPDVPLVMVEGVDEQGRPSRVLGPAIVRYLAGLDGPERVILLVGEVAPDRWWQQVLFNNRGSVVARYVGRHSTAVVCRFRFRLLPRRPAADGPGRRSRSLVLPRH